MYIFNFFYSTKILKHCVKKVLFTINLLTIHLFHFFFIQINDLKPPQQTSCLFFFFPFN